MPRPRSLQHVREAMMAGRPYAPSSFWSQQVCWDQHMVESRQCRLDVPLAVFQGEGQVAWKEHFDVEPAQPFEAANMGLQVAIPDALQRNDTSEEQHVARKQRRPAAAVEDEAGVTG